MSECPMRRFMGIAEQMGRVLQRTSISVNIKERLDFSCALFDSDGESNTGAVLGGMRLLPRPCLPTCLGAAFHGHLSFPPWYSTPAPFSTAVPHLLPSALLSLCD